MKYTDTQIGFQEFPNEISLLINISNCPFRCSGCHSPELWKDVGEILDCRELHKLIEKNKGITLIGFMGGVPELISELAEFVKACNLKVGWYWGGLEIPIESINLKNFDYIKVGPYIKERGPLNNPNTNQKMYEIVEMKDEYGSKFYETKNITHKFWDNGNIN